MEAGLVASRLLAARRLKRRIKLPLTKKAISIFENLRPSASNVTCPLPKGKYLAVKNIARRLLLTSRAFCSRHVGTGRADPR